MTNITDKKKETLTIKQLSENIGVSYDTIKNSIKRLFPDKIKNGIQTLLNEKEITLIIDDIKNNNNVISKLTFEVSSKVQNTSTSLTPALKIKQAMEMMQEAYEEELEILRLKNEEQQQLIEQQQPKVEFYDKVIDSKDWIDMGQVAKVLNDGIGRNKIFEILRDNKILDRKNNPYQQYQDKRYFRLIETSYNLPNGDCRIYLKTLISQKGLDYIRKVIKGLHFKNY